MKNNRLLIILLSALLCGAITGCGDRPVDTKRIETGNLRHEIFKECIENPKIIDEAGGIVNRCESYAYYIECMSLAGTINSCDIYAYYLANQ